MEANNENQNALLNILKAKQNHEEYDQTKLTQLLQQIHSSNQAQIKQLQQEIDKVDNINKLCNLTLQIKIFQYMRQNSSSSPVFSKILNSWSINNIPQWITICKDLSKELSKPDIPQINIEKVHSFIYELVGTIAEVMYKADSESPQKFLFKQVLPLFGGGNTRRKGTDIETDLDIMQMDTTQLDEEAIARTGQVLEEFNQSLLSVQDQLLKLLDISESDLKTEDRLLNIIHLTLHISEVSGLNFSIK